MVVDLTVENNIYRTFSALLGEGLPPSVTEVDDGQPGMAKSSRPFSPLSGVIWTTVTLCRVHSVDEGDVLLREGRPRYNSTHAAHGSHPPLRGPRARSSASVKIDDSSADSSNQPLYSSHTRLRCALRTSGDAVAIDSIAATAS